MTPSDSLLSNRTSCAHSQNPGASGGCRHCELLASCLCLLSGNSDSDVKGHWLCPCLVTIPWHMSQNQRPLGPDRTLGAKKQAPRKRALAIGSLRPFLIPASQPEHPASTVGSEPHVPALLAKALADCLVRSSFGFCQRKVLLCSL